MRLRLHVFYALKLLWYWASKLIVMLSGLLASIHIFPGFFKGLIAARAAGAGSRAYREKRYKDAITILKPVADFDIDNVYVGSAQYMVGLLYFHGLGVEKDIMRAENYFSEAAQRQNDDAINYFSKKQQEKDPGVDGCLH